MLRYSSKFDQTRIIWSSLNFRQIVAQNNETFFLFAVPKIEDGNNFGVAVQEETLGEIQSVESEAAAFFDQISRYFISRAKIVSKVAKYPHIDDYRRAVQVIFSTILHDLELNSNFHMIFFFARN